MKNSEIVKEIIETLEKEHINLYHDVTKEKIDKYIKSIAWNKLNDIEFDREMLKLFHQFKDAHTNYYLPREKRNQAYKNKFRYINHKAYIIINEKYYEVLEINNISIKEIVKNLSQLLTYETESWKNFNVTLNLNNPYYLKMLGITSQSFLNLKISRGKKISEFKLNEMTPEELKNSIYVKKFYSYKVLEDEIIHIKYSQCAEMKDYPFSQFVKDVKKACKDNVIKKYVMDLRGNIGGDSSIIKPLVDLIEKLDMKGVVLIDNGVFSSGRFAVADFKRRFNLPMIGQNTGGAAASYGYNKNLTVADKSFSCSIRFWDFSDVFGYAGAIQPDVRVVNGPKDREKGIDKQLEEALKILNTKKNINIDKIDNSFKLKL